MYPSPDDLDGRSDDDLRSWIVETRPGWQQVYDTFVHDRYGHVVKSAVDWTQRRHGVRLLWEEVIERLFTNLYGGDGQWKGLKSWSRDRGPFSAWLWVVVRNVCYAMIRTDSPLDQAASVNPTGAFDESDAGVHPASSDPSAEDVATVAMLLEQMSAECARLLRWKYFYGMTDEDIARHQRVGREWANRVRRRCERALADVLRREGLSVSDFNF